MDEDNRKFNFTYFAPTEEELREIDSIRKEYLAIEKKEARMDILRKLDRQAKALPKIGALSLGVVGTLIVGLGMAMVMEWKILAGGIVVSLGGVALAAVSYPIYKLLLKRSKRKYGQKILALSDELLNNSDPNY